MGLVKAGGTRNNEQVGKRRFVAYGESCRYCESSSLIKLPLLRVSTVLVTYYTGLILKVHSF